MNQGLLVRRILIPNEGFNEDLSANEVVRGRPLILQYFDENLTHAKNIAVHYSLQTEDTPDTVEDT